MKNKWDLVLGSQSAEEFFDSLSDGIIISDKNGKIIVYNRAKEIQENRDRKNMLGKYTWDAYGYSGREGSEHWSVYKTGIPAINKYSAHSVVDGEARYISYSTYPLIIEGETVGVYSVSKTEDTLHQNLVDTIEKKREFQSNDDDLNLHKYNENGTRYTFSDIIGESEEMRSVVHIAQNVSFLDNTLLIIGETGTGKEVLAQSIHNFGEKFREPFIGINCSAIPENLLESMLFGTEKGVYTGAVDSAGLFEKAGKGTIFLDDINTMPLTLQAKLLRAIQERRVSRLGSAESYEIKCRIISATNEDPFKLIGEGRLREDLYYRIAGYTINIPSLRNRREDIIRLVEYFIRRYNKILGKSAIGVDNTLKVTLDNYFWPGNIRELENLVENMLVNTDKDEKYLTIKAIPPYLKSRFLITDIQVKEEKILENRNYNNLLDDFERRTITEYLIENNWNISKTARILDLNRNSLIHKIKRLEIKKTKK